MARARLHIICGNCGCSDEFKFNIEKNGIDMTDTETKFFDAVHINCGNCGTLHSLENTINDETIENYVAIKEQMEKKQGVDE